MRKLIFIFLIFFVGCCPCRHTTIPISQDSVRVEVVERIEWKEQEVTLPRSLEEVTIKGDSSYLENSVAATWAIITKDGNLVHSLFNKPSFSTTIPHHHKDSTIYFQSFRQVIVEVEKPDTWWEQTQKKGFWTMLAYLILRLAWKSRKLFLL